MRYIVVGLETDAELVSSVTADINADDLSIIVAGKGADLTLGLSIAVARHAPVALVRSAWTINPDRIREQELDFQDFVYDLPAPIIPVVFHGVPDIASSVHDEEWVGKLRDFANSDDYAERNPFAYRR